MAFSICLPDEVVEEPSRETTASLSSAFGEPSNIQERFKGILLRTNVVVLSLRLPFWASLGYHLLATPATFSWLCPIAATTPEFLS